MYRRKDNVTDTLQSGTSVLLVSKYSVIEDSVLSSRVSVNELAVNYKKIGSKEAVACGVITQQINAILRYGREGEFDSAGIRTKFYKEIHNKMNKVLSKLECSFDKKFS